MISKLISWSLKNRYIVLLLAAGLFVWGILNIQKNPIDAIPDLSENQVIVFTEWMGRGPQIMEDQVTYPLVSNLQGIPKVKNIRGTSMFGMSFVYVIFEDDVDVYWARTRVLERLNYAQRLLPTGVTPTLGPDGTGVGHVFWYTLDTKNLDLGEQRALQDWYVKLALQTVPGVAEVASFGGFEKQYQLVIDPVKLQFYNISLMDVMTKVKASNNDVGGRKFEMSDMAYIIRGLGYIKSKDDIESIGVGNYNGIPVRVKDIGTVQMGGDLRLGIFDENGEGEVVGGIVVMRYGENADKVIGAVKEKMKDVQKGLPEGVTFKTAYDRSELIEASIGNIKVKLIEEMTIVALIVIIGNFGWDFIYRDWGGKYIELADRISETYRHCDRLFRLPFAEAMSSFPNIQDVGLTGAKPKHSPEYLREKFNLDSDRPTALLTFGGLSLQSIPYQNLANFSDWQFVTFDRDAPDLPNLTKANCDRLRPVDLMVICDRIVTKPGYGTLAEALRVGIPVVCLTREGFLEAETLIAGVKNYAEHLIISPQEFYEGDWSFLNETFQTPDLTDMKQLDMHGEATINQAILDYFS